MGARLSIPTSGSGTHSGAEGILWCAALNSQE